MLLVYRVCPGVCTHLLQCRIFLGINAYTTNSRVHHDSFTVFSLFVQDRGYGTGIYQVSWYKSFSQATNNGYSSSNPASTRGGIFGHLAGEISHVRILFETIRAPLDTYRPRSPRRPVRSPRRPPTLSRRVVPTVTTLPSRTQVTSMGTLIWRSSVQRKQRPSEWNESSTD
jgi:hypothetical protein